MTFKEDELSKVKLVVRDSRVGTTLDDRYLLVALIGRGATSSVYQAEDTTENRMVAVKILHSHLVSDVTVLQRFEREAKTSKCLRHPNIVEIFEFNVDKTGAPYLVMELVSGTNMFDVIKAAGWMPVPRALAIVRQVCAALSVAHEMSIVHRDLKPSNIMLTESSDGALLVKVLDFGIAKMLPAQGDTVFKLTQSGETLGSLLYMSPEQCLDQDMDGRSDCYALGCLFYEAITGRPPLSARTAFETMNKQISQMPEPLERVRPDVVFPPHLQSIIFKMLAKNPSDRYMNIGELQDDLKAVSDGVKPNLQIRMPITASTLAVSNDTLTAKDFRVFSRLYLVATGVLLWLNWCTSVYNPYWTQGMRVPILILAVICGAAAFRNLRRSRSIENEPTILKIEKPPGSKRQ